MCKYIVEQKYLVYNILLTWAKKLFKNCQEKKEEKILDLQSISPKNLKSFISSSPSSKYTNTTALLHEKAVHKMLV